MLFIYLSYLYALPDYIHEFITIFRHLLSQNEGDVVLAVDDGEHN